MLRDKAKLVIFMAIFLALAVLSVGFYAKAKTGLMKLEGTEIEISTDTGDQQNPHAIFLPDKNLWFVVYEDWSDVPKGAEIKGVFIKPDGTKCGTDFFISSNTDGNGNQTVPRAAYRDGAGKTDSTDRILVVWQDTRDTPNDSGYIYYAALNVSSYTSAESQCSTPSPINEVPVPFEDDDPVQAGVQSKVVSRAQPRVIYDPVNDRFLMAWVESRETRKTISYTYTFSGGKNIQVNGEYGDKLFVGYASFGGDLSVQKAPTLIVTYSETSGATDFTRARRLSQSQSPYSEKRKYESFNDISSLDLACDTTANECIIAWEGLREELEVENNCADDPAETTSNGVCDSNDIVTTTFKATLTDSSKAIYGLFEKNFDNPIPAFKISSSNTDCYFPSIGLDPITKKFLVAWETLGTGNNQKIYGQLIISGGGLYNKNFLISYQDTDGDGQQDQNVAESKQTKPYVSYDSVNQRYFVAWQDGRNGSVSIENLDIYGQYVDSEGTLRGTNYAISTAPSNQQAPAMSYSFLNNQFLAVWKDGRNTDTSGSDIYGQRFSLGQPQLTLLKLDNTPLSPALIDFGSVTTGQFSTYSFKIKNTGDASIHVDCVSPNPYTLTPFSFDNLPQELVACSEAGTATVLTLVPGSEVIITSRFSPTQQGTFTSSFTIKSDGGDRTIALQGVSISPDLTIQEGDGVNDSTLNFGSLKPGQSKDVTFSLINNGTLTYNVTSISGLTSPFNILENVSFPFQLSPGEQKTFTVRYNPNERGTHLVQLVINTDKPNLSRTLTLSGTCIAPVLSVTPTLLDFGVVTANTSKQLSITIYNTGDDDLAIASCGTFPTGFSLVGSCPTSITPGEGSKTIVVSFTPTDVVTYSGSITIQTNAGSQTILLSGIGGGGKISVSVNQLDFGVVSINTTKTLSFQISNVGNDSYNITAISSPSSPYTMSFPGSLPIKLLPGTSFTVTVSFTPTASQYYSSSITVANTAINGNQVIELQGFGVTPELTIEEGDGVNDGTLKFGSLKVGQSKDLVIKLMNKGAVGYNITSITGIGLPFSMEDVTYPIVMSPGSSKEIKLSFVPTVKGNYTGQILINTDKAGVSGALNLEGKCIAPILKVSPTTLEYGLVSVGSSKTMTVTVS
ncbi:MAG: choice-of-anchor D domain-containing protein, partial [candidate division WOR-3 bacterium]